MSERPGALIFRKRLLPWSETFIASQGRSLRRYHPVFVGYKRVAAGPALLGNADQVLLEDHAAAPPLSKGLFKAFGVVTPRWRRALAERRPAVLHAHFGMNAAAAIPLARTFDIPLVVTYHGMDITIERSGRARRQRERVFREATSVIAVSRFIAGKLLEAGCPEEKLVVHTIGVDTSRFAPGDFDARERAQVLFVGRLVEKKGGVHLLRALPRVREAVPEVSLVVAGDGPLRGELEAEATRHGVPVRFLGVQPPEEVRRLMRTATVMCAPSIVAGDGNAEGLPMTIMEAQASGLPVVAFPSGGSAEGLVHGESGYVAPPRDEGALAAFLVELLTDAPRRRRFGEAARALALERFDLAKQATRLEAIYDAARGID